MSQPIPCEIPEDSQEIPALIETLAAAERRLEEVTCGEVDSVVAADGRTFLLGRAQEQLRHSEAARQAAILNALPAHIALLDANGVIISVNEAWRSFADANRLHSPGHALGVNYLEVCDSATGPDSTEARAVAAGLRAILSGASKAFSIEYPCHSPDEHRCFQLTATPLAEGGLQGAIVMHLNISARKLAEDVLRVSESNMAAAQSLAHVGSWELELGGPGELRAQPLHWSDEMFRIAGFEPGEVFVTNDLFFKLVPPEEHAAIREAMALAIRDHAPYSVTHRFIRPDGQERTVLETAQIVFDEQTGLPKRVVGAAHDITDRKRAEDQMTRQAALLDIAQDGIFVKDLGDRILYWNKGAERIYGWTAPEAVGCTAVELFSHDTGAFAAANTILKAKGEWGGEMSKRAKDGRTVEVDVRWTLVMDKAGRPEAVLALNTDITEKKKLAAQFLRVQRMESIGTLASGIAHDLNNVLAPIMMSVEMLKEMAPAPEAQNLLDLLQSCTQRGANLVKQVLSFARGVEGRRVPVNVVHILRDLQTIVRDTFPKNITFEMKSSRDLRAVLGDPTQLHQVFMNLLVNARDAMPLGGTIKATLENVAVDEIYSDMNADSTPGQYVLIRVQDSGSGIPASIRNKIFEPFFTTKEMGKGTGLGLSTTIGIVKSHGGFISLYSEVGKGAQFNVHIPATLDAAGAEARAPRDHLPRGQGELLLIVDDEEPIRNVTQRTLEKFNYRVLLAANGAEAVAIYARHGPEIALVLTDMAMPVMDGPAAITALRVLNPHVKIIGCSGHASSNGIAKALGAGLLRFIPKPYTAEALLKTLREVLSADTSFLRRSDPMPTDAQP